MGTILIGFIKIISCEVGQQILSSIRSLLRLRLHCPYFDSLLNRMYSSSHQDSWNNYAPIFIQPTLSYQNHQISCLLDNKTLIYDSSFSSELTANSYSSFVGVGGDEGSYIITANIITNEISACSILIYFNVKLNVVHH